MSRLEWSVLAMEDREALLDHIAVDDLDRPAIRNARLTHKRPFKHIVAR